MRKFNTIVLLVLIAGTAGLALLQQRTVQQLRKENQALRAEIQVRARRAPENAPPVNVGPVGPAGGSNGATVNNENASGNAPAVRAVEQLSELLRLRSEVGRLRKSVRENAAAAAAAAAAKRNGINEGGGAGASGLAPSELSDDYSKPFTANLNTSVTNGQTLIAGGWATEPGKRMLLLLTPEYGTPNITTGQVALRSVFVQMPEEMLTRLGLSNFQSEGRGSSYASALSSDEAANLMTTFSATAGVDILTAPRILTVQGREAEVTIGPTGQGPSVTYIPSLSSDQQGLNIAIKAQLPARPPATNVAAK